MHDGTPVLIRPIERTDLELERAFVNGLSRETRYRRLMSGRELLPGELERWTDVGPAQEIALIAVASVIGDEWQGHGRPGAVDSPDATGVHAGIEVFAGITLSANHAMLVLARRLGLRARREAGDATVTRIEARLWQSVRARQYCETSKRVPS